MKSMIDDYFGQCPEGKKGSVVVPSKVTCNSQILEESSEVNNEDLIVNGKENKMSKEKGCKTPKSKSSGNSSTQGRKSQKKKSSVTQKHHLKEDNLEHDNDTSCTEKMDEVASPKGFAFKIRIKSKEQHDNDDFIDDLSSPERHTLLPDSDSKELKSPPGTLFKYLIPKNSSEPGKESVSDRKTKNISDFFSPTKDKNCATAEMQKNLDSAICSRNFDEKEVSIVDKKTSATPPSTSKLVKKRTKKSLSMSKTSKNSKEASPLEARDSSVSKDDLEKNVKLTSKPKSKTVKKSLSLTKNECKEIAGTEHADAQDKGKKIVEPTVTKPETNAFKKIMSKANQVDAVDALQDSMSKKRKRGADDDLNSYLGCKSLKSVGEDSPVKTIRKGNTLNQIMCDSDDDTPSVSTNKQSTKSSLKPECVKSDTLDTAADGTVKSEESRRNSLMSYFSKVSKEEILAKEEKIEMKVKALIHSPPTTPSKKVKRRSVNSLPGGSASLCKKKPTLKNKLKDSINAIEAIDTEEVKTSDLGKSETTSHQKGKRQATSSSTTQNVISPLKIMPGHINDSSNVKPVTPPRSNKKKSLSKVKVKQEVKCSSGSLKEKDGVDAGEESLATPLANLPDELEVESSTSNTNVQTPWKLKVCLTPQPLPTIQGTLLEEESDSDEIFLSRQDKKRKVDKQTEKKKLKHNSDDLILSEERSSSPDIIFEKEKVSDIKIAPLFTRKADTQARQLFLQSGVPEQVKRTLETQRSFEEQEVEIFPKQSHVQQKNGDWAWTLPLVNIPLTANNLGEIPFPSCKFSIRDFNGGYDILDEIDYIISTSCKGPVMRTTFGLPTDVVKPILRVIKEDSKNIMVVNTFKTLRRKYKEDDFFKAAALSALADAEKPKRKSTHKKSLNSKTNATMPVFRSHLWTEKYRPSTASEIVGNSESVQQLKRWLEAWRKISDDSGSLAKLSSKEAVNRKKRKKDLFDDDDFVGSDNSCDSANSNSPLGVAVLYGPNGNGKTSTVYALAKDLGYKVLEVNASEKRNGKLVLSKLSEATQSHQVQQSSTAEQGFAALFGKKTNTAKKISNQALKINSDMEEDKGKKMSLILFEDVDVVFEEEDEGFLSAIANLVSTSKRPVILTTTDPESPMVNRFMNNSSLILHFSCPPNLISSWLQIVSVVEGIYAAPNTVQDLVALCKGDFRRALLQMQLWVMSGASNLLMPSLPSLHPKTKKNSKRNDNDDISDNDVDDTISAPPIPANTDCIAAMLGRNFSAKSIEEKSNSFLELPYPLDLGLFWWNLPPILSFKQVQHDKLPEKSKEDLPVPGRRRMLDESFIASFCTDDNTTDSCGTNDDSEATSSQTGVEESGESQDAQKMHCTADLLSTEPNMYRNCCSQEEMNVFLLQMFIVSSIDVIAFSCHLPNASCLEPISRFSRPLLKDSLSLVKEEVQGPNQVFNSTAEDICHWLAEQSLNNTRTCFSVEKSDSSVAYNNCLPNQDEYRWRDAHSETQQGALLAIPLSMRLERRAIATDYLPALRTFCRLERNRSIINIKRRNRFYHYLKSLGAFVSEQQLEILCGTMCVS